MTTYAERLKYLAEALGDEDCPAAVYRKYQAERLRIIERIQTTGPSTINLDEEIPKNDKGAGE